MNLRLGLTTESTAPVLASNKLTELLNADAVDPAKALNELVVPKLVIPFGVARQLAVTLAEMIFSPVLTAFRPSARLAYVI